MYMNIITFKINNETNFIRNACVIHVYYHIVTRGEVRGHTYTREFHVLDLIKLIGFQKFLIGQPRQ